MGGVRFTEKEILATEAGKLPENVAKIRAKGGERQKKQRPHEPVDKMNGLEKSFLYYWHLCGGENEDWLFGQHPFPERPRMHVDFTLVSNPKIVVEIDGGQFMDKSGHNNARGVQRDAEKLKLCNRHGITLYRLTSAMVNYDEVMSLREEIVK